MQHGAVTSSSRGLKFSLLRSLPSADAKASTVASFAAAPPSPGPHCRVQIAETSGERREVASTLHRVQEQERAEEDDNETDQRIRRHRYAQLVMRLHAQRSQYYSTGVFVEAMLKEAQHATDSTTATLAAIATWGLHILARESRSVTLTTVMDALLPAIYCNYEPGQVCTASPAVQLQVREKDVIDDNPYFTHAMYIDAAQSGKQSATELRHSLKAAVKANDERRGVALRLLERQRRMQLSSVFRSWRSHIRQSRLIQLISDNRAKREAEETAQLRKQAVFYEWRLLVERSRNTYLTERLHDAAFQLENAKNQFQLQCYRADRLVQSAKDATDELARVSKINAGLTQEVALLREERAQRERQFNRQLTDSVTRLLKLLSTYDELSRVMVRSRKGATHENSSTAAAAAAATDENCLSPSYSAEGVGAKAVVEGSPDVPLKLLRRWVNDIVAGVRNRDTPLRPLRAFSADFADGERYLYLLQHVFPDVVSGALAVSSMGVEARLRRIRDYAVQCKLRYVLLPSDFINEREDLLVCSLCELRLRYLVQLWRQSAQQSAAELDQLRETSLTTAVTMCAEKPAMSLHVAGEIETELREEAEDGDVEKLLDFAAVTAHIADYVRRLQRTQAELESAFAAEAEAADGCIVVAEEEARLGSERLRGAPIPLVEESSRRVFWQLATNALSDLRGEPQLKTEASMWDFTVTQSLPAVLRDHVDIVSRLFFFFAGENAKALSEVAFWRFVELSGVLVSPFDVSRQWIATQYDHVVSPQLDAALRAAALNQSEMSVQKLREVAYQEMDIRTAAPIQFVELLVRIAVAAESGEYGLVEGTRRLLQRLQLPSAERMTTVERDLCTAESQNVLRYFSEDLFRIFLFYMKQQESSRSAQERAMALQDGGRFSAQMSVTTFLSLLDDCRYLSDGNERGTAAPLAADSTRPRFFVSTAQIRKLVPSLGRQRKVPTSGYLSFGLFVDVLAALAYHWCPDPLVPAPRRLAAFLSYTIQKLNARHSNSTLLLGSAPAISLEGAKTVDFSEEVRPNSASR
jgi:hypothetical protein